MTSIMHAQGGHSCTHRNRDRGVDGWFFDGYQQGRDTSVGGDSQSPSRQGNIRTLLLGERNKSPLAEGVSTAGGGEGHAIPYSLHRAQNAGGYYFFVVRASL